VETTEEQPWTLVEADALDAYGQWPAPSTIVSDGAYGVGGFPGDPRTPAGLADWYAPHVEAWSRAATLATTLWFWNTEVGWATVHPLLIANGWRYEVCHIWDKGIAHVSGNVNGKTARRFPVVTEVCVFYTREPLVESPVGSGQSIHAKEWLLEEWKRTGLPRRAANEACGVKDAATRKYFDQGWLWYWPPPEAMEKLVTYANEHGAPEGRPYYSLDGLAPVTFDEWSSLRSVWNFEYGVTNVWNEPALRGRERYKGTGERAAPRVYTPTELSSSHLNQKPLRLMRRIVNSCTNEGDVLWEPFGGLCSASVAAVEMGRRPYAAEVVPTFAAIARERLDGAANPPLALQFDD
jgi:site-specific DNA-methyltransferase (adenine-specific)